MNIFLSILQGIGKALLGEPKAKTIEELRDRNYNLQQFRDYTLTHWTWEADKDSKDEWQEPHRAFESLQSYNTPSDCDDYATATWFCLSKRYDCKLLYVTNGESAHAVCMVQEGDKYYYLDNIRRSIYPFKSILNLITDIYSNVSYCCAYNWNGTKFVKGETVWQK